MAHGHHRSHVFPVTLGDPAPFVRGVEVGDEVGDDACDERLEAFVPAELVGIEHAVAPDDPAEVAGLVRTEKVRGRGSGRVSIGGAVAQDAGNGFHGGDETALGRVAQGLEECGDVVGGAAVEDCVASSAVGRQADAGTAGVVGRALSGDEPAPAEVGQDAAQVSGVEVELAGEVGGAHGVAVGELVEDADGGEGKVAGEVRLIENVDAARIESIEAADGIDGIRCGAGGGGGWHGTPGGHTHDNVNGIIAIVNNRRRVTAPNLAGRTVLITGANSGLGRASAHALAAHGATLVLAARSEARTQPVLDEIRRAHPAAQVEFLRLDLASLASVRAAAERVLASGRRLDVLMNNAGVAGTAGLTEDGFEITIGTNYIGHFYLTSLLVPRLLEAPNGRIVNIASVAHERVRAVDWRWLECRTTGAKSGFDMYAASKLMNILHARELARRLAATHVTTYAVHPGGVASNIWRSLPWIVRRVLMLFLVSNEEGARTQVWCATAPELATSSGRYYYECREARGTKLSRNPTLGTELYDRTEHAIADALAR